MIDTLPLESDPPVRSHALLEVEDLERQFDGLKAVDGISFTVAPREVVSIIGPNGSGKTTTLNLVTGTIPPHGGRIALDGVRIDHADTARIAEHGVARTFQNGRVFATLSVADNVEVGLHSTLHASRPFRRLSHLFGLRWIALLGELFIAIIGTPASRRERRQIDATVETEIHRFEDRLGPRRDDPAYSLSYANRRRTEIARALALQPKLLVLDEPTAGMNPSETAEVLEQLLELKAAGQAILLVEHKLDLVMAVSDRIIVMDGGRIIAQGPPEAVRHDPAVVEAYLGRRRGLGGVVLG
ncbi:ABC transporter ATP-binding protein [Raineyella sp. W15-4]|uniref:ABC transporter ATP-binding protein n=1 Tax=Raineyella sp. W15-4 TaxID=3081651 RepID=UPI002955B1DA|nr:ABC transporter ATP-binding protein [Raineyella sp. W15-4]WOQ16931.1 ABC transporter ATP-binding protein [Raineyella sp. W15-4]